MKDGSWLGRADWLRTECVELFVLGFVVVLVAVAIAVAVAVAVAVAAVAVAVAAVAVAVVVTVVVVVVVVARRCRVVVWFRHVGLLGVSSWV